MAGPLFSQKEHQRILHPLLQKIEQQYHPGKTAFIGIQGGQGTGKTTLVRVLQKELEQKGYLVSAFSIDDFYLPLSAREKISQKYPLNPFYQIPRGLPGTHDLPRLQRALRSLKRGEQTELPLFDKSLQGGKGDLSPFTTLISERQDIVLFEGWCVGIPVVSSVVFLRLCRKNKISLSAIDSSLKQHLVVLDFITKYQPLWKYLDYLITLKPKSISSHVQWRQQQEQELKKTKSEGMSRGEVQQFVDLFLPFTYLCYEKIKADATVLIEKDHLFSALRFQ